jgi:catechol 2,3-dioxygenase-like lactoylglutathione lyase family enzyme
MKTLMRAALLSVTCCATAISAQEAVPNTAGDAFDVRFDNVAISVSNVEASAAWYAELFGFTPGYRTYLNELEADFQIIERGDIRIELISRRGVQRNEDALLDPPEHLSKTRIIAVVFSTDNLEAATARMEELGVQFVWKNRTLSTDGLRSTLVRDPDGNIVNLLQYPSQ